jgi:hypothetical protein
MHPQRPSDGRETHQAMDEVGKLLREDPELVDDDDDAWQPRQCGVSTPRRAVLVHVGNPQLSQQPLAPTKLSGQRGERSRGEVPVEVGDDPDDVRKLRAIPECSAALVVHEQKGHLVRAVHEGQRTHQGLKQLRLPGSCRPGHQDMRTIRDEVHDERTGPGNAEHRPRGRTVSRPSLGKRCAFQLVDEVEQSNRQRKVFWLRPP